MLSGCTRPAAWCALPGPSWTRGLPIRSGRIQTTVFDSSDGVRSHAEPGSAYSPRVAKSADGKLWFLPCDGVSVIDPRHLPFNKLPPPVHIEQIIADRKTLRCLFEPAPAPLTRDLEIDYTALSLVAPEKNRFASSWKATIATGRTCGNERKAFYNDLPPRNYRFRVMASNNSGVWNEAGASFDFSIAPAYYQTAWFQASVRHRSVWRCCGGCTGTGSIRSRANSTCAWTNASVSAPASRAICMTRCCRAFKA